MSRRDLLSSESVSEFGSSSLKTGGIEVARERWDESELTDNDPDESMDLSITPEKPAKVMLPDWTRPPMSLGAPSAAMVRPSETAPQ